MAKQFESKEQLSENRQTASETRVLHDEDVAGFLNRGISPRAAILFLMTLLIVVVGGVLTWSFFNHYSVSLVIQPRDVEPTVIPVVQITPKVPATSSSTAVIIISNTATTIPTHTPSVEEPISESTPEVSTEPITIETETPILQEVKRLVEAGTVQRDAERYHAALALLVEIEGIDPTMASEIDLLRNQINYALDALNGTIYLEKGNTTRLALTTEQAIPLVNPIDMTLSNEGIYIIDSGTLYRTDLSQAVSGQTGGDALSMTEVLTPTSRINGFPLKEIVAVEATNIEDGIYVLDKSNDIYHLDLKSGTWSSQRSQASEFTRPDPHFLNISGYNNLLYLLDPSRNQIWRYPPNEAGSAYLPSELPWLIKPGDPDITTSVDVAIDGFIYALDRDGAIVKYNPFPNSRFSLDVADGRTHLPELEAQPLLPKAIYANTVDDPVNIEDSPLYVADAGRRRVVALDRNDGSFMRQFVAPDNPDFSRLHDVVEEDGQLFMLAGANLYVYDVSQGITNPVGLEGALPEYVKPSVHSATELELHTLSPNDPLVPELLASYGMTMPVAGALLPDRFVMYPGARRAYRYGVHRGLDFYEQDVGVEVRRGTPVLAVADGMVVRADTDFQEMGVEEMNTRLDEAFAMHITPEETLDKLGGRQVWIDHDGGVLSKYEHLSGIAEGVAEDQAVEKGQVIGYVGSSGTPDNILGNPHASHLHFEIRLGEDFQYYLGQWLTVEDTRRMLEKIFAVSVYSQSESAQQDAQNGAPQPPSNKEDQ